MTPSSEEITAAKAQVDAIRKHLGYPSQEYLDKLNDETREGLFELLDRKDEIIGASILALAKSLYTSKARFVFELLQNAEDNHYSKARNCNEAPYVSFHVYSDRIVQECNEDGFSLANLKAICSIGQSSKSTSQAYIGEKGIGFKSVFMVASRAYIQSGDFSFYFEHQPGDIGMGMIAPQWQETNEYLGDKLTRITLFLLRKGMTAQEVVDQGSMIRQQFEEIHDAILLFMSKIKNIKVIFYREDGGVEQIEKEISFSAELTWPKTRVKRTVVENGAVNEELKHYFASTHRATSLAKNENREYGNQDSYSTSDVTLAFPLKSDGEPSLDTQWVFAYLPTSRMGFKFLIQADFVTQANREGIVATSPRNRTLMLAIARSFLQAVKEMRQVPSLRYTWMRYLPKEQDFPWPEPWPTLINEIAMLLRQEEVLESAHLEPVLKLIGHSRLNSDIELDSNGIPLLPDLERHRYVSLMYKRCDLTLLQDFGLQYMAMNDILQRAKYDLEGPSSRIKTSTSVDVQSRIAKLLTLPFTRQWENRITEVKQLKMLLCRSGNWYMSWGHSIYFSRIVGTELDIPRGMGWKILDSSVEKIEEWNHLYELIEVKKASLEEVHAAIAKKYDSSGADWSRAAVHLHFLYQTHHLPNALDSFRNFRILNTASLRCSPFEQHMYIEDTNPYGVAELLRATPAGDYPGSGAPGKAVNFIHGSYFDNVPKRPTADSLSWREWIQKELNIRLTVPLLDPTGSALSEESKYLALHRPDRFLGFVHSVWSAGLDRCVSVDSVIEEIATTGVACRRGRQLRTVAIQDAYLPLKKLTDLCERFLLEDEFFPFVELKHPLKNAANPEEWREFCEDFDLGYYEEDSVGVLLQIAAAILEGHERRGFEPKPQRLYNFYLYLYTKSRQSEDYTATCAEIRESLFQRQIFIPCDDEWDEPRLCVWETPKGIKLNRKYSLSERLAGFSPRFEQDRMLLADFFVNTLKIAPTCTWGDLVEEIRYLKSESVSDFANVYALYECISSLDLSDHDISELRAVFIHESLIYDNTNGADNWYMTPSCLWSSATSITGMFAVNSLYEDLKPFFVNILRVQTRTVSMVYKKLKGDTTHLSIVEMKSTLLVFSALLESEGDTFDPKPILENKVFPVICPDGSVDLFSAKQDFAIRDREHLSKDFENKAWMLDFSMAEAIRLRKFIKWCRFEARYLSDAAKEICSVDIDSARRIVKSEWQVSHKAYALTRIAATFNSPRLKGSMSSLYATLKNASTLETDSITCRIVLNQNNTNNFIEKESSMLYVPDHASELKVYLSSDELMQEVCFNSKLPRRLCQWLMSDANRPSHESPPVEMVAAVQSVLSVGRGALPMVLDEHGIVSIDLSEDVEAATSPLPSSPSSHTVTGDTVNTPQSPTDGTDTLLYEHGGSMSFVPEFAETTGYAYTASSRIDRNIVPHTSVVENTRVLETGYSQLLVHVVEAARRAIFPSAATSAAETVQPYSGARDPFELRQYGKLERDRRVGAAGELFVYELLLHLVPGLSDYSTRNWRSTIRHYATMHPEYISLESWNGTETSDIVYKDTNGIFTRLLIERGYFDDTALRMTDIEYYIEVKTTTDDCKAPFYMSHSQFEKVRYLSCWLQPMQEFSLRNSSFWTTKRLYIIFRVFHLTRDEIGLSILVDPHDMCERELLSFVADTWSVTIN